MDLLSINPATGQEIAHYPHASETHLETQIANAAETYRTFRKTSFETRAAWMRQAADLLEARTDECARLMTSEMGKPIRQARAEVQKCALACRFYADHAASFLADEQVATEAAKSYVSYQPLGPVLAVMPWNFPFWQVFRFAAPALMAGNVALLKHAPNVTGCALAMERLVQEAGFPDGCFQTLLVPVETVENLLQDPRIKAATLTGSVRAGRAVGGEAAAQIKPSVLELGGSDAFIVLADADLPKAVETGVMARMQNNGQSCIAGKRFILEEPIAEAFIRAYVERVEALRVGDPMAEDTDLGPLARADLREGVHDQVQRALAEGATLRTGGQLPNGPGFFYPPTVLSNVLPGSVAFVEEIFGPVAAMIVAEDADHAIALANDTDFGLGGAIFTGDRARGERLALELEAGCTFVNAMVKSDPRLPFGGIKTSGYGRELSHHGIREFVNIKTVWID